MIAVLQIAACVALFFAGHVVRDGWPALHSTHGARALGATLCATGVFALSLDPLIAGIIFAGIFVGFYTDCEHGAGQGADNAKSYLFLLISGVTSLLPLAVALDFSLPQSIAFQYFALAGVGLVKPPIWGLAWLGLRGRTDWFVPTRIAAGAFGALIGAALAVLL
jgi:hypothetical protein